MPFMPVNDGRDAQDKHLPVRSWEEWRQKEQQPGIEPHQEPMQLTPIPADEYPTTTPGPKRSPRPGKHQPVQLAHDPESVTLVETPAPVSPPRTRPFLPGSSRVPEQPPPYSHVPVPVSYIRPEPTPISPAARVDEVQPSHVQPAPTNSQPPTNAKTNSQKPAQTIRSIRDPRANNSSNSPHNSHVSTNSPPNTSQPKPNSTIPLEPFERIGKVGRQRRYEVRKDGINSVRDVVLWRHVEGRAYPHLSRDMKRWYEFFYFTTPMKGEKPYNANTTYEQHVEAYERGQAWIRRHKLNATTRPLGNSAPLDLQARRAAH